MSTSPGSKGVEVSIHVRVKREVEELVRGVAAELGYSVDTVRNTAILYGLMIVAGSRDVPGNDGEFAELLRIVKAFIEYAHEYHSARVAEGRGKYVRRVKRRVAVKSAA